MLCSEIDRVIQEEGFYMLYRYISVEKKSKNFKNCRAKPELVASVNAFRLMSNFFLTSVEPRKAPNGFHCNVVCALSYKRTINICVYL